MKRFFLFLLTVYSMFSLNAQELSESSEADFQVALNRAGNGVVIIKYIGRSAQVRIPSHIQGFPVVEIGESAFDREPPFASNVSNMTSISQVIIPDGVTTIVRYAFSKQDISILVLPNSVVSIGEGAFKGCINLTTVTLSSSLTNIGGNTSLSGGEGVFSNCNNLSNVIIPNGVTIIGISMFSNCYNLKEIIIPESIREIRNNAFEIDVSWYVENTGFGLTSIIFNGNNLRTIGNYAFKNTMFTDFIVPEGVTQIGDNAFADCFYLKSITLPSTITTIGTLAFLRCISLETVIIPESVTRITFRTNPFISGSAFSGCISLTLASQAVLRRVGWNGNIQ